MGCGTVENITQATGAGCGMTRDVGGVQNLWTSGVPTGRRLRPEEGGTLKPATVSRYTYNKTGHELSFSWLGGLVIVAREATSPALRLYLLHTSHDQVGRYCCHVLIRYCLLLLPFIREFHQHELCGRAGAADRCRIVFLVGIPHGDAHAFPDPAAHGRRRSVLGKGRCQVIGA